MKVAIKKAQRVIIKKLAPTDNILRSNLDPEVKELAIIWTKLLKAFVSARTALWLMIFLGMATIYGITISRGIFTNAWFWILAGALCLNIASCTIRQYIRVWRQFQRNISTEINLSTFTGARNLIALKGIGFQQSVVICTNALHRRGYRAREIKLESSGTEPDGSQVVYGWRGRLGYWGSPFFHTALLIILIGGIVSGLGRTTEDVVLNEGGQMKLQHGSLSFGTSELLTLKEVNLDFNSLGKMTEWQAHMEVERGNRLETQIVNSEHEFEDGLLTISIQANGYTPGLIIRQNGQVVARVRLQLKTVPVGDGYRYEGQFSLPGNNPEGENLQMNFWPNFIWEGKEPGTQGDAPLHPALSLSMIGQAGQSNLMIIKPGESAQFGDWSITFDHVKPWLGLRVGRDPGYILMLLGFWVAVGGLFLLFLWIPREIFIKIALENEQITWAIKGRSHRFKRALVLEIDSMIIDLQASLTDGQTINYANGGG